MDGNRIDAHVRHATLVIVGAGFSGTALALALLRDPPAATCTIVQVRETVDLGGLDPEAIVTPGIFVHRVVRVPASALAEPQAAG